MLELDFKPDPDKVDVTINAIQARQPIGDLYIGSVPSDVLIRITDFDVRRVIQDERDVEKYLGIQRPLDNKRVKSLQQYVNFKDATFPTACILAVDSDYADFDEGLGKLTIRNYREGDPTPSRQIRYIARVLDGQHRIAGLWNYDGPGFEVPVVFFVGADIAEQANIFSTVNLEQNKVGRSLAYDLFALAKSRSPQRLCHEIAVAFDSDEKSPFYHRIKRLGIATPGRYSETISQAQFVEGLLNHISADPKQDRDVLLRGRKLSLPDAQQLNRYIFRKMFVEERDIDIARSVDSYFQAIKERWPDAWNHTGKGAVLSKTNGFRALIRLMRPLYHSIYEADQVIRKADVLEVLNRSGFEDTHFNTENYQAGTGGETKLFHDIRESCGIDL